MTIEQKLQRIQGRGTAYELAVTNGDTSYLVQYTRRGRPAIVASVFKVGEALAELTGSEEFDLVKGGARVGTWNIRFTGRTQREAIIAGELTFVGERG